MIIGLAWRNFNRQRQRYRVLLVALILGAVVFSILFGASASLSKTVREKAARYFSGDLAILAYNRLDNRIFDKEAAVMEGLKTSGLAAESYHRRSSYYSGDAQLFFNGSFLIQRRVIGIDYNVEKSDFLKMDFSSGGLDTPLGSQDILISEDTAQRLHLKVGDQCILMLKTNKGYSNTVTLTVKGIFADTSFFGFACYMDYRTLNKAMGRDEEVVTELGITLAPGESQDEAAKKLYASLKEKVPTYPLIKTKEEMDRYVEKNLTDTDTYGILTLTSRLKQINDLTNGIVWVSNLLAVVFLLVVMIGVFNTYQMIVFERTREIGTLRAMGMQRTNLMFVFLTESAILGFLSALAGIALGALALAGLASLSFHGNAMVDMFLVKGHLVWTWPWQNVILVVVGMVLTGFLGSFLPAWKASRQKPVDALRHE